MGHFPADLDFGVGVGIDAAPSSYRGETSTLVDENPSTQASRRAKRGMPSRTNEVEAMKEATITIRTYY